MNGEQFRTLRAPLRLRPALVVAAAASIFFAYVGFDAVSTAAEETKNPQRNMPIGLIGSLAICTVFYLLVAAGRDRRDRRAADCIGAAATGSRRVSQRTGAACAAQGNRRWSARRKRWRMCCVRVNRLAAAGNLVGLAADLALPSVILMMMFGQTRIFFVMSRDGLLPEELSRGSSQVQDAARGDDDHRGCRGAVAAACSRLARWPTFPIRARCSPS